MDLHYEVELGIVIGRTIGGVGGEVGEMGVEKGKGKGDWEEERWMDYVECELFVCFLFLFCFLLFWGLWKLSGGSCF